jgi:hypothetical protein
MENLANNKLIAEFMGGVFVETNATLESNGYALRKDGSENSVFFYEFDLPYDRSWDWLMPVVEKIESFEDDHRCCKYNVNIQQCWVEIIDNE